MANSVANNSPDTQKRRTSRIEQAVPLTVLGVDALGRPFQERTSTLIVNCHGCRYQSKHYVLKNMWVTLEVPHPEMGHEPRSVRGRVMWIQRPRTVRELFQVGVELEAGGNLWGIAFPPADWFDFTDTLPAIPEIPAPAASDTGSGAAFGVLSSAPAEVENNQPWTAAAAPEAPETNLRTMPFGGAGYTSGTSPQSGGQGGGTDPSLLLARQMMRLVNEAKQQLQSAARESAAQAVAAEARRLITALHNQLQDAAKQSVASAVASVSEQAVQGVLDQAAQASEAQLKELRARWDSTLAESVEQASQSLRSRMSELEDQRRSAFLQELETETQKAVENLHRVTQEFQGKLGEAQGGVDDFVRRAGESAAPAISEIEQRLRAQIEETRAQIGEFERATHQWNEQMSSATSAAQSNWQSRLQADLDTAGNRWNERIENSMESAAQQAAARIMERSQETAEQIAQETGSRITALSQELTSAGDEVEHRLTFLRGVLDERTTRTQAVLAQVEAAARNVEEQHRQFESLDQAALQEMERRGAALLEAQSEELTRRAEMALSAWMERLQPAMEEAGRQTVDRLGVQLESGFSSHLEHAGQLLGKLESGTHSLNDALRAHEDELGKISEQSIHTAIGRMQGAIERLEHDLEESGRTVTGKWLTEIDAKATETTHTTFESLFKTSEWYEKKVHTQMQTTLEKGMEQAHEELRKRAGEISGMFASELDHYSRSYVEHTQGQIEETGRATVEIVGKQLAGATANAAATVEQRAQKQTDAALNQLRDQASVTVGQTSSHLETLAAKVRAKFESDTQRAQAEFRAALTLETQQAVGKSRQELAAQTELAKADLRTEGSRQQNQLRQSLSQLGDQFIENYKRRLESASNSWLLTTVSKLNEQSARHLDDLARSADARLRESCGQVFASVGETLRQRLADIVTPAVHNSNAGQHASIERNEGPGEEPDSQHHANR